MTPVKSRGDKKEELLQLRIDKKFLDRLNEIADKRDMPLSSMLRLWISERLHAETRLENKDREEARNRRLEAILQRQDFKEGPLLVVQISPSGKAKLDMEMLRDRRGALVPGASHRMNVKTRTLQQGLEVSVYAGSDENGPVIAQGQAFKTGEVETVLSLSSENGQIFGHQMDFKVVTAVQDLCSLLRAQQIEMPYIVHLTILRAKNYSPVESLIIASSKELTKFTDDRIEIAADIIVTSPEQLYDPKTTGEFLLDAIDEIWHAAGQRCSKSFDSGNKWANPIRH